MDKQQRDKLLARSEHLLDLFIALREKYAMLLPLAFDGDLAGRIGRGPQVRGHTLLRNVLLQSCVQDLVKLTLDVSPRVPSASNIMQTLDGDGVREALKAEYIVVPPPLFTNDAPDPDVIADIIAGEKERLSGQFDEQWLRLSDKWAALKDDARLAGFKTWRDTLIAHSDLRHSDGVYRLVDLAAEGLKWSDLGDLIDDLQVVVDGVTVVCRSAGFAWGMLDEQLREASSAFWRLIGDSSVLERAET